jgi:hypothetical protein
VTPACFTPGARRRTSSFKSDQWLDAADREKNKRPATATRMTSETIVEMNAVHIATT